MSNITIIDASGDIRSENWPPSDKPIMLDQIADQKRKAAQDAYQALKEARGGLKSTSRRALNGNGSYTEVDNTTGATRHMNADGTERS